MKKILVFSALALIALSMITVGCNKQTDYPPSMAAVIDSISFAASGTGFVAKLDGGSLTMTGTTSIFTPGTTFNPSIKIIVASSIGTHTINKDATAMVYTSATGNAGTAAVSGQVVVLNNNSGKIQGNFTFTCADGTTVKNGRFTANQ